MVASEPAAEVSLQTVVPIRGKQGVNFFLLLPDFGLHLLTAIELSRGKEVEVFYFHDQIVIDVRDRFGLVHEDNHVLGVRTFKMRLPSA